MSETPKTTSELPVIEHADVRVVGAYGRIEITMHDGWVFYDKRDYRDDKGNYYEPEPEYYIYSRYGVFSPTRDFSEIVVVAEEDVPANQIFAAPTDEKKQ